MRGGCLLSSHTFSAHKTNCCVLQQKYCCMFQRQGHKRILHMTRMCHVMLHVPCRGAVQKLFEVASTPTEPHRQNNGPTNRVKIQKLDTNNSRAHLWMLRCLSQARPTVAARSASLAARPVLDENLRIQASTRTTCGGMSTASFDMKRSCRARELAKCSAGGCVSVP